jgi:response regulator RpfG family c-di-GMP phosphodiesterase
MWQKVTTGPKKSRDPSERIARRLLSEGRIGQDLHDAAMRQRRTSGVRFEEALVEAGMPEEQLLRALAETYRVQYISTAKLAGASVDKRTLGLLPAPIAEARQVVPVLLDRQKSILTVVTADPDDLETVKDIELATQVRTVRALVARPAAVHAAVAKFYGGNEFAFSTLMVAGVPSAPPSERDPVAILQPSPKHPPEAAPVRAPRPEETPSLPPILSPAHASGSSKRAAPAKEAPARPAPAPAPPPAPAPDPADVASEIIGEPFQLAVVLVSLLEGNRKDLRGHSIQTARLVRKVCERFGLDSTRTRGAEIGALFHDLGKTSSYHLTPYNVARFEGHRAAAEKLHSTPGRVVQSANLSASAVATTDHMYERYDGSGFPSGLRGSEIPLSSRILAICDTYADLTTNPRNSFRKILGAQEACDAIRELQGTVFDPKVVDHFVRVVLGDDIAERLRSDRGTVLLVDADVEETTVLELALIEKLYDVHIARAADEALRYLETGDIDIVVSEMALPDGTGIDLLAKARATPKASGVPFVFFSDEADSATVAAALEAGAVDYLFKPLASQVVVAKLRHLLEQSQGARQPRGVTGSLQEMALPELVQILNHGRKSGLLQLDSGGQQGRIFFKEGAIVDVSWRSLRGEEAFYALVGVETGQFKIDPSVAPQQETVRASPEMLLLEGLRRLDEAKR